MINTVLLSNLAVQFIGIGIVMAVASLFGLNIKNIWPTMQAIMLGSLYSQFLNDYYKQHFGTKPQADWRYWVILIGGAALIGLASWWLTQKLTLLFLN